MKVILLLLLVWAVTSQDWEHNPRRTSSGLEFEDSHELLRFMHIKQHKMEDHYVKQIGTVYIFYHESPRDLATRRHIEEWREDVYKHIKDIDKYIDIEEVIVGDDDYDDLLNYYDTNGKELRDKPLVLIDEFDERVWVYRLNQTKKIKERLKSILTEGVSYFNY